MSTVIRRDFFTDPDGYAAFPQQKQFAKFWRKICDFEKRIGKSVDYGYTRDEYIELFNITLARSTSSFYNDKKCLMYYIRYLIAHGVLPEEQEDILASVSVEFLRIDKDMNEERVRYFKNLNHLRFAIDDTKKNCGREDDTYLDVASAILYLAWFGLTEEQIATFPKTGVLEDGIMLDGQKIEMPYFVTELLNNLKNADGFYTKGRGRIFRRYMYSENLIRTEDSYQLSIPQMRANLSRMDSVMGHVYSLKYRVARQSGIFYRAYMLECESRNLDLGDPAVASEVFCENLLPDESKADPIKRYRDRMRDYFLYKQLLP